MAEIVGRNEQGSSRRWVPMVLLGALLFVALNAWMSLRSVKWLEKSQGWLVHTWQVIAQVERLMSSAKDAETGSRGYLLTGQESFREPYVAARRALPAELAGLKALTADNASQQVRAAQMREVMQERLALLEQSNLLRSTGGNLDAARAVELMDTGKAKMDRLRGIADAMEGEEQRLLVNRTREAATAARRVR